MFLLRFCDWCLIIWTYFSKILFSLRDKEYSSIVVLGLSLTLTFDSEGKWGHEEEGLPEDVTVVGRP